MAFDVRTIKLFLAWLLLGGASARAVTADQFDYNDYFRTGVGRNNKGGNQNCFTNPLASDHNDFRLGNECGSYSELKLRAFPVKAADNQPFFAAETMFSFGTPNGANAEPANLQVRELFIEGGKLFGKNYGYWVGKRYYRDVDAHMDDFFYFEGITGNGAGITNVDTGFGKLGVALFLNTLGNTIPFGGTAPNVNSSLSADIGSPQGRYLDVRLANMPMSERDRLHLWLGFADQQAAFITSGPLAGQSLGNFAGALAGARYRRTMANGTNDLTFIYGYGLLSRFNTENIIGFTPGDPIGKAQAIRALDHMTVQYANWAMHAIATVELRKNYQMSNQSGWYASTGVRPVYFVADNFHLAVELGHDESQDGGYGNGQTIRLTRLTVAPEIVAARDIWSRPSLRFFYSVSFWNSGASGLIGGPAYVNNTIGTNWGFQGEVWF